MRIAIVGAGAMGGLLAARFALAGEAVTVVDRGPHLEAMQRAGLKLINPDGSEGAAKLARAVASPEDAGPHDVVFLAVKANLYATLAPSLPAMLAAPRVGPAVLPVPRELPQPPADFTGRAAELATLRRLLRPGSRHARGTGPRLTESPGGRGRPVVISAIDGMGGIGKPIPRQRYMTVPCP